MIPRPVVVGPMILGGALALAAAPAAASPATTSGMIQVKEPVLYYEEQGQGPPVVLIHGGNLDRRMWDDQFALLAKEFRVVRYDVRGYGKSDPPHKPFSDATDLLAVLDQLGIQRPHLVGLSLGGRISIDFAVQYPDRVASMTLVGPGLGGFQGPADAEEGNRFWATVQAAQKNPLEAVEMWLKDPLMIPAMENPALAPRVRQLSIDNSHIWLQNPILNMPPTPRANDRLDAIKVPVLLVLGDRDTKSIKANVERLQSAVAGARTVHIAGAGHLPNMEKPAEFNRVLLDFLMAQPR